MITRLTKKIIEILAVAALLSVFIGCDFNAEVIEEEEKPIPTGIEIVSLPNKTEYQIFDTKIDTEGLQVNLVWNDGMKEAIDNYLLVGMIENLGESEEFQELTGLEDTEYSVGILCTKDGVDYTATFNITVQNIYDYLRSTYNGKKGIRCSISEEDYNNADSKYLPKIGLRSESIATVEPKETPTNWNLSGTNTYGKSSDDNGYYVDIQFGTAITATLEVSNSKEVYSAVDTEIDRESLEVKLNWSDGTSEVVTDYSISTSIAFEDLTGEETVNNQVTVSIDGTSYEATFDITVQSVYDELRALHPQASYGRYTLNSTEYNSEDICLKSLVDPSFLKGRLIKFESVNKYMFTKANTSGKVVVNGGLGKTYAFDICLLDIEN